MSIYRLALRRSFFARSQEYLTRTCRAMSGKTDVLAGSDPEQIRLMGERVILVDKEDNVRGSMSKKDSHLVSNDLPLHRAFSVFLFDEKGRMLLQRRAAEKVTFPSYWTNTVCSHPLHTAAELGELDRGNKVIGAKRAAIRKLSHELGVAEGSVALDDLHYMTRILYRAECGDGIWGEHEMDYIFITQKKVELEPSDNEVRDVRYVTKEELKNMFKEADTSSTLLLTPWFRHIVQNFGWAWWDSLLSGGTAEVVKHSDCTAIHNMY